MKFQTLRAWQCLRQNLPAGLVVGFGVLFSVLAFVAAHRSETRELKKNFQRLAEDRVSGITHELEERLDDLNMLALLCSSKQGFEREEFQKAAAQLRSGAACIQAFEWVPRVPRERREEFEQAGRRLFSHFEITELAPGGGLVRAGEREEYYPVYYIEPSAGNEPALGFDAAAERLRRQILAPALASGKMVATPGIRLVQERGQEKGVLIQLPVYEPKAGAGEGASSAGALPAVRGLVAEVLRAGDFVESALGRIKAVGIDVLVLDASSAGPEACLHTHWSMVRKAPPPTNAPSLAQWRQGLYSEARVPVADREWLLVLKPTEAFLALQKSWLPEGLLAGGLFLTSLFAVYLVLSSCRAAQLARTNEKLQAEIAERRRAEQALRLPQFAMDNVGEAILWVTPDAGLAYVNKAACSLLGYSREELLTRTVFQIDPIRSKEAWPAYWAKCKQEKFLTREGSLRTSDNRLVPVELTVNHFEYEGQEHNCTFVHDITQRKAAEERLRAAEERWRTIFDSAPDAYYLMDTQGVFINVSKLVEQFTNYGREELIGRNFQEVNLLPPEQLGKARGLLARGEQGEATGPDEFTLCRKDGRQMPIEIRTHPLQLKEQVLVLGIARDITERKEAEAYRNAINALLQLLPRMTTRKEYLDAVVNLLGQSTGCPCVGIRIVDLQGRMPYECYRGFSPEFWATENWLSVAKDRCACTRVITGQPVPEELPVRTAAGSFHCSSLQEFARSLSPAERLNFRGTCIQSGFESMLMTPIRHRDQVVGTIHLADKTPGKLSGRMVDLVETMAPLIGDALHKLAIEDQVRASLAEKEILLKEVHHRVKNNLQVISSLLQLQEGTLQNTDPVRAFQESRLRVKTIALVHEKLYQSSDLARIDFAAYTRSLTSLLLSSYAGKVPAVTLHLAMEQVTLGVVQAIPCGLIINELVSNALKHAFPPGHRPRGSAQEPAGEGAGNRIEVGLRREEKHWVLWVQDNGAGLPAGFELAAARSSLGLTIVSLLTRQLGGSVEVRSQGGTTFTIQFAAA